MPWLMASWNSSFGLTSLDSFISVLLYEEPLTCLLKVVTLLFKVKIYEVQLNGAIKSRNHPELSLKIHCKWLAFRQHFDSIGL